MSSRMYSADTLNPFNRHPSNKCPPASRCTQELSPTSSPPAHVRCSQYLLKKSGEICLINPVWGFPKPPSFAREGRRITAGSGKCWASNGKKQKFKESQTPSCFANLPVDILELVISNLDHNSILRMSEVSSKFYRLCRLEDRQWRRLFTRDFGTEKMLANKHDLTCYELYRDHYLLEQRMKNGKAKVAYLTGHEDTVYCVAYFSGRLVSGGRDNSIKIWDVETGGCIETKKWNEDNIDQGHQGSVLRLRAYPDKLISCSSDGSATIWDKDFKPLYRLREHEGRVLDACQPATIYSHPQAMRKSVYGTNRASEFGRYYRVRDISMQWPRTVLLSPLHSDVKIWLVRCG